MKNNLKIGIVSDGKYGERAYENISKKFKTEWILVPDIPPNIMLDDDIDITIPLCDLYVSYVRHPDIILILSECQKPLILGVLPGVGLYQQAKRINPNVIYAPTMCSLENNTGISEIDDFIQFFGRPKYELKIGSNDSIDEIHVYRSSLCGSTEASAKFLLNKEFNKKNLQEFALSVCHECRAPRFGHTCDKEVAGIIHLVSLLESVTPEILAQKDANFRNFIQNIKNEYINRSETSRKTLNQVI